MSVQAIKSLFNIEECDRNFQLIIKLTSTATPQLNDLYVVYARERVMNLDGTLAEEIITQHVCEGFIDCTFPRLTPTSTIPVDNLLDALDAWVSWKVSGAILTFPRSPPNTKFTLDKENVSLCSLMRWIELCTSIALV
jgi:hypothetical protein